MNDSKTLLRQYAREGNDGAFRELVKRHVNLVYSAALRVLGGNESEAEEVVQGVFTELARKAAGIRNEVILSGWLYQVAIHQAKNRLRSESRRRHREQEAVAMNALVESDQPAWDEISPVLDEAMGKLSPRERDALVLRYFEKCDHRSVGSALGLTDDAAQKCVSRALEKLRGLLHSRGIHSTASALSLVLLANSLQAAPEGLTSRLPGRALAGAAATGGVLARWKLVVAAGVVAAAAGVPLVIQHQRIETLEQRARAVSAPTSPIDPPATQGAAGEPKEISTPTSTPDLIAEAARVLKGGAQHFTATSSAMNLLAQIPDASIPAALEEILKLQDVGAQTLLFKYLLGRWAESHSAEALAFARDRLPTACRVGGMEGLLDAWGGSNPRAGVAMMSKTGTLSMGNNSLTTTLYRNLASKDLGNALNLLVGLNSQSERGFALRGIMEGIQTDADRSKVLGMIQALPDEALQLQARRSFVERWADHDALAAADWVTKIASPYDRSRLMDSLCLVWLQRDPQTAADWWIQQAPGNETLTKIVNVWAHEDPNAAGTWLRDHATGQDGDDARMTFARQVQELDPESAFAWAETITQPVLREATIDHLYRSWRLRDAENARQYLEKNAAIWPADRTLRLNTPPPTTP